MAEVQNQGCQQCYTVPRASGKNISLSLPVDNSFKPSNLCLYLHMAYSFVSVSDPFLSKYTHL